VLGCRFSNLERLCGSGDLFSNPWVSISDIRNRTTPSFIPARFTLGTEYISAQIVKSAGGFEMRTVACLEGWTAVRTTVELRRPPGDNKLQHLPHERAAVGWPLLLNMWLVRNLYEL
jgi:hypothetical protein